MTELLPVDGRNLGAFQGQVIHQTLATKYEANNRRSLGFRRNFTASVQRDQRNAAIDANLPVVRVPEAVQSALIEEKYHLSACLEP